MEDDQNRPLSIEVTHSLTLLLSFLSIEGEMVGCHKKMNPSSLSSWFSSFCSSALRSKTLTPPSDPQNTRSAPGEGLVRRLGLFDLILLGIGASIGAGIFVVTGTVARDTGPGKSLSLYLLISFQLGFWKSRSQSSLL